MPIKPAAKHDFDEIPIKPAAVKHDFDDMPIKPAK